MAVSKIPNRILNLAITRMMRGGAAGPATANPSEDGLYPITNYRPLNHDSSGLQADNAVKVFMTAGEALSANECVWVSSNSTVKSTLSSQVVSAVMGITLAAAANGALVPVVVLGVIDCTTDDALSAGDMVKISTTTAGRIEKATTQSATGSDGTGASGAGSAHTHTQTGGIDNGGTGNTGGPSSVFTLHIDTAHTHSHGDPTTGSVNSGTTSSPASNTHTHSGPSHSHGDDFANSNESAHTHTGPSHSHTRAYDGLIGTVLIGASANNAATILVTKMG